MSTTNSILVLSGLFAAGCAGVVDGSQRIDVEDNGLGVSSIAIDRSEDQGGRAFELRGLDADDHEIASVRLRTGEIADLHRHLRGVDDVGSEIVLSFGGKRYRTITREVERFQLGRASDPAMQAFLELDTVSSALERERIQITRPLDAGEASYTAESCPAGLLLTTPIAGECCHQTTGAAATRFIVIGGSNNGGISYRAESPYGACKSQNGGSCSGDTCYWGPNGFARPQLQFCYYDEEYGQACSDPVVWEEDELCVSAYANHATSGFPNITGTFATLQGCPGGATGAGEWDY